MRISIAASCLALALSSSACTRGSGDPGSAVRDPGDFDAIDVSGPFQVQIEVGPAASIVVSGDDNVVPKVRTEVVGSTLHIDLPGRVVTKLPLSVAISVPALSDIDVGGASTVTVAGLETQDFEVDVSGASQLTLTGRSTELEAEISGASRLSATGLQVSKAKLEASGASKAEISVDDSVDAEASGASTVRIHGSPDEIARDVSGASTVELVD
ncbi:MAG: head GIN domain-containing protein [Nannocystaceae bacterium]